MTNKNLEVINQ